MPPKSLQPRLPRNEQKQRSNKRLINFLLMGIIAENSHHSGVAPETRLAKAREALLGETPARGRKAIHDDLKLFPLLDEALQSEKLKIKQPDPDGLAAEGEPSQRGLAKKHAAAFANPYVKAESTQDWLRRAIKKMSITSKDMADLEGLFHGDSPQVERLQRIFDDLNAIGIASKNPIGTESADITPKQD
jgi:hypothetical protein